MLFVCEWLKPWGTLLALVGVACTPQRHVFIATAPTADRGANTYALSITEDRAGLLPEPAFNRPAALGVGAMSHAGPAADYTWRINRGDLVLCQGNPTQPPNCARIDTGTIEQVDTLIATASVDRKLDREKTESIRYSKNGVWLLGTINGKAQRGVAYCSELDGKARCNATPLPDDVFVDEVLSSHELFRPRPQHVVWLLTRRAPRHFAPPRVPGIVRCSHEPGGMPRCVPAQKASVGALPLRTRTTGIGLLRDARFARGPNANINVAKSENLTLTMDDENGSPPSAGSWHE